MLKEKIKIKIIKVHEDDRGLLAKIFDYSELRDKHIQDVYVTCTKAGENRANHYHKKTTEWFCAIKGKGIIKFKDIGTNEEFEVIVDGEDVCMIQVPPGVNHHIFSKGDGELIIIAFGDQPYTKEDDDTYSI